MNALNQALEQDAALGRPVAEQGWRPMRELIALVLEQGIPTTHDSARNTFRRLMDERRAERRGTKGALEYRRTSQRGRVKEEGSPDVENHLVSPPSSVILPPSVEALIAGWGQLGDLISSTRSALVIGEQHRRDAASARDTIARLESQRDEALELAAQYETAASSATETAQRAAAQLAVTQERAAALEQELAQARLELTSTRRALRAAESRVKALEPLEAKRDALQKALRKVTAAAAALSIDISDLTPSITGK